MSTKAPYHVFVYAAADEQPHPKGGLHDLVSCEENLEKARRAVESCARAGRGYHIAVVDPQDLRLTVVERGSFKSNPRRTPTEVLRDPLAVPETEI